MMEYDIRTALMIISAIAIFAILLHGMWKIRKNRNPYKLKAKVTAEDIGPVSRNFDGSGFDQDGVGQIKAVTTNALTGEIDNPPQEHEIPNQPAPAPEFNIDPIPKDIFEKEQALAAEPEITVNNKISRDEINHPPIVIDEQDLAPEMQVLNDNNLDVLNDSKSSEETKDESTSALSQNKTAERLYDTPVTNPKPEQVKPAQVKPRAQKKKPTNQLGFNFSDELSFDDEVQSSAKNTQEKPPQPVNKVVDIEPEVIVLSVIMPENKLMSGASLLPILLTLGMKYGDMNIFHRHEDNAGNGKITFSLANMMNPGTFDLDTMESFSTQGVSLFMTLPNPGDAFKVFEQMLSAAKQLAQEFNGQLLDDKRSVMTKQTEQHYISKIREFDRKYRIAAS